VAFHNAVARACRIIGCGECAASVVMILVLAMVTQVRNKAIYALCEFILPFAWGDGRAAPALTARK
jgi:hypothetical protein